MSSAALPMVSPGRKSDLSDFRPSLSPVQRRPLAEIKIAPENDLVYRPADSDDPAFLEFVENVRKRGVLTPLAITRDGYVVSGHRRHAAATLAGLEIVPVQVIRNLSREEDVDLFIAVLVDFNRSREKSLDETLREQLLAVDAGRAYDALTTDRAKRSLVWVEMMDLGDYRGRKRISEAKRPLLDRVLRILDALADFLPLSDRKIHYELLNDPPLRHAGKPGSVYRNDIRSYKDLCDLLTRARLTGEIPFAAIADETRPVDLWRTYADPGPFVAEALDGFLRGYWRDLLRSQPNQIELLCEKNTVRPILAAVAQRFTIPMTTGRGYSSLPPRAKMAERFRKSGKDRLILLVVSDFDPEGEDIAESFGRSMRDDFGLGGRVDAIKVALTREQAEARGLPKDATAKLSSSRARRFIRENGRNVWELEALAPADLQRIVEEAIEAVIDVELFNAEIDREHEDAAFLAKARIKAIEALKVITT